MSTDLQERQSTEMPLMSGREKAEIMEKVLLKGDISALSPEERVKYYFAYCQSLGLNPLTRPLEYLSLPGKEGAPPRVVLYARKECAEQLRVIRGISITDMRMHSENDLLTCTISGIDKDGRTDISSASVWIGGPSGTLKGDQLAILHMKCQTKAKRRFTLSIAGLGLPDESEIDDIKTNSNQYYVQPSSAANEVDVVQTKLLNFIAALEASNDIEQLQINFKCAGLELRKLENAPGGKEAIKELVEKYKTIKVNFDLPSSNQEGGQHATAV